MKLPKVLFYLFALMICLVVPTAGRLQAQAGPTYYVANGGADTNDGLSEATAWQTLEKASNTRLEDNATLLFKRGDIFRGKLSLYKTPVGVTIGAYGTGDNPVIAGSVAITGWTKTGHASLDSTNVYEADVSAFIVEDSKGNENTIQHLFAEGELMTIARYPNVDSPLDKNWLIIDETATGDAFKDAVLTDYGKPNDYWNGARLRIRNYSWTYKVLEVTDYVASTGKIVADGLGGQLPEWGYFLDDKLEEIDYPGEWYYDSTSKKVYLYPKDGVDPNQTLIEGATYATGLSIGMDENQTTVENLTFKHFTGNGLHISQTQGVVVKNCHFDYNLVGLSTWNSNDALISSNHFDYNMKSGIGLNAKSDYDVGTSTIEKNQISNSAMIPVYGRRYEGTYNGIGISVFGKAYTVRQNTVENTGWIGIYLKDGGHHIVENNVVRKSLQLLNDGGAIGIGSDGNIIRGNFMLESLGNVDESNGCSSSNKDPCSRHSTYGMGLAADSKFQDNLIEENTVANNPDMGIRLNSFVNTTVRNNILYNNDPNIVVQDKNGPSTNNTVSGNIIYALGPEQIGLSLTNDTDHGTFKNNKYCNPYSKVAVLRDGRRYSLAQFKSDFSDGVGSTWCDNQFDEFIASQVGQNLISNSIFDNDVSGWSPSSKIVFDPNKTGMDGGSLRIENPGDSNFNLIPNTLSITQKQWYRLKFSLLGDGFGTIRLRSNRTSPDYEILETRYFAYDKSRTDYSYFFQASETTDSLKHLFTTQEYDANYWIDNVTFEPVTAALKDKQAQSVLFSNQTDAESTVDLGGKTYYDLAGQQVTGSISLQPFRSQILITDCQDDCPVVTPTPETTATSVPDTPVPTTVPDTPVPTTVPDTPVPTSVPDTPVPTSVPDTPTPAPPTATPIPYDLSIKKNIQGYVQAGSTVNYYIRYINKSPHAVRNLVVVDELPEGMTYLSDNSAKFGSVTVEGNQISWQIPTVQAYKSGTIRLTVQISDNLAPGTELINQVTISAEGTDNNPDNNTATIKTTINETSGSISGLVTDTEGNPLVKVGVRVFYKDETDKFRWAGKGRTDEQGQYQVDDLASGDYYLKFVHWPRQFKPEFYDDVTQQNEAKIVEVQSGQITKNINAQLESAESPKITAQTEAGRVTNNPTTGQVRISVPTDNQREVIISSQGNCADGSTPDQVSLTLTPKDGEPIIYTMKGTNDTFSATIPADQLDKLQSGLGNRTTLEVSYSCAGETETNKVGSLLIDPSGYITDARSGEPIENAQVTLYYLTDWSIKSSETDTTEDSCHTVDTKGDTAWNDLADAPQIGRLADPDADPQEIDPLENPLLTTENGYYGWNVKDEEGCWYVVVEADGYETRASPAVGVPPEVTDLDLTLTSLKDDSVYIPIILVNE
ncbi:right-handed parallel beta-helix repeat-containing protein [Anaerolineales bacterium HSG24]|nr:right-handed parallel beta-helix repeat-containing protein [Anaerolineales bacterium HSG24]